MPSPASRQNHFGPLLVVNVGQAYFSKFRKWGFKKKKVKSAYEPGGPSGRRLIPVSVAWSD